MLLVGSALLPAAASAATVSNGDFEAGSLSGWQVQRQTEAGDWFAYRGTEAPLNGGSRTGVEPIPAPPQGRFAAISDEVNPDALILWQDVALEPNASHVLSLTACYQSELPLATPSPNSLSVLEEAIGAQANEQFRVDVIKPTAPLDTLNPEDILATLLAAGSGSAQKLKPTRFSADLTAFAGQTVRIRAAVTSRPDPNRVETGTIKGIVNAGIDAVAITSDGPGVVDPGSGGGGPGAKPGGKSKGAGGKSKGTGGKGKGTGGKGGAVPGDKLRFARARPNRRTGTVLLAVRVPAAGQVSAAGAKQHPKLVRATRKRVAAATTANLILRPTRAALRILARKHKLRTRIAVRFDPDQGATEAATVPLVFKLAPAQPRH